MESQIFCKPPAIAGGFGSPFQNAVFVTLYRESHSLLPYRKIKSKLQYGESKAVRKHIFALI